MSTDSEKIDIILSKVHSIDIRLSVLETSVKGIPAKVSRLESDSKAAKTTLKVLVGAIPVLLVLIRWLGLGSLVQAIGEIK